MTMYSRDDLQQSTDDRIKCSTCYDEIELNEPCVYFVGTKEGFFFHHVDCARENREIQKLVEELALLNEDPEDMYE